MATIRPNNYLFSVAGCLLALLIAILNIRELIIVYFYLISASMLYFSYQQNTKFVNYVLTEETEMKYLAGGGTTLLRTIFVQFVIGFLYQYLNPTVLKSKWISKTVFISFLSPPLLCLLPLPRFTLEYIPLYTMLLPIAISKYIFWSNVPAMTQYVIQGWRFCRNFVMWVSTSNQPLFCTAVRAKVLVLILLQRFRFTSSAGNGMVQTAHTGRIENILDNKTAGSYNHLYNAEWSVKKCHIFDRVQWNRVTHELQRRCYRSFTSLYADDQIFAYWRLWNLHSCFRNDQCDIVHLPADWVFLSIRECTFSLSSILSCRQILDQPAVKLFFLKLKTGYWSKGW